MPSGGGGGGGGGGRGGGGASGCAAGWRVVGVDVVINHSESRSAPTELLVPYC